MQDRSKSGRGRKSGRSPRRRANATVLTTFGNDVRPISSRPDVVTQDELGEYHGLKRQKDRLDEEIKARRASIIRRLEDGASIVPGFFDAEVRSYPQRKLTAEKLEEVLGYDEVEKLKCMVTPTPCTQLWVTRIP